MKKATKMNGWNVYGQKCVVKTVVINRETAMQQYKEILDHLTSDPDHSVEYNMDMSCFTLEEQKALYEQFGKMMQARVALMTGAWKYR